MPVCRLGAARGEICVVLKRVSVCSCHARRRSVFDRLMTSKKTLVSIDRGVAVTKVLVRADDHDV